MSNIQRIIPDNAVEVRDEESDAVAYLFDDAGRPCLKAFYGRQSKPVAYYYYSSVEKRQQGVERAFNRRRAEMKAKAERKAARNAPHTLKVGDILVSSWGYEQTNIDYYQVVRTTKASVVIRAIASATTSTGHMTGTAMPVRDQFTGPEMTKRANSANNVRIDSVCGAWLWDGRARNYSTYA